MGQITIFTREGCPNCQAVRLDLKLCHLPYEEIVLDPEEIQKAPLVYFDNQPIVGGVNELLDMLQDWEVVDGPDGKPTLVPMCRVGSTPAPSTQDSYHEGNHRRQYQDSHNQDAYRPQNNHHHGNGYDRNGYSRDTNYSAYPRDSDRYSRGDNYREDAYREDNRHQHHQQNRDYGYRDGRYGDENYREDSYRRDHHRHTGGNHHDPYRDPQRDNTNNAHLRDAYNHNQRNTDPYNDHYKNSDPYREPARNNYPYREPQRNVDHYDRDPYPQSQHSQYSQGEPHRNVDDPYRDSQHSYRDPQRTSRDPYGDARNAYSRSGIDDPYGQEPYSRRDGNHSQHNSNHGPYGQDSYSRRDGNRPQHNSNNNRDARSHSPYKYGDEKNYRENSYRDRTGYDGPCGPENDNRGRAPDRNNDSIRDARSIEAIQNRFQSGTGNRDTNARDAYGSLSRQNSAKKEPKAALSTLGRREQFQKKDSYEHHSFHGGSLQRQVVKQDKYQDDRNTAATAVTTTPNTPGSRRDMFRKKTSYDRHSYSGKTLLQKHQSEMDEAQGEPMVSAPAAETDRFGNRRDMFRRKTSYDRHSFHGKTLRQQQQQEENYSPRQELQKSNSQKGSSFHGNASTKGSAHGSAHASNSLKGSVHGSAKGGGSVHGSTHSRRSIHVDLDKDCLAGYDSEATFSNDGFAEYEDGRPYPEGGEDEGGKDYSYYSAKDLDEALSRISQGSNPRRSSKNSLSPEDLMMDNDDSEHSSISMHSRTSTQSNDRHKPTKVYAIGNEGGSRLERFRQNSTKSLNSAMSLGKASSMRLLNANDTTSSADGGDDERAHRSNTQTNTRSMSPAPPGGGSKKSMNSGLRAARSAALLKKSSRNNMNTSTNSHSSTSSIWSISQGPALKEDKRCVELPLGNIVSILDAVLELKRIIPLGPLKHNLTTYRNSVTGTTVCDTFQERYNLSRREAEDLGKSLRQAKLIRHVLADHEFADTEKLFFRLQCHQTPEILNSFCLWQDELSLTKNGTDVMDDVMGKLLVVMDAITDSNKGRVHYSRATKQHKDLVADLDFAVCELQMVKLARFDKNALLAFGLNVYQLFLHYAFIKVGIPSTSSAFNSFWTNLKFNIGGDIYSFADWWNGICRGNRKGPHGPKPFQGKDARCYLNLPEPVDPRIHFAAGMTHFLRPMFVYSGENIRNELEHVANIYCKNVEFVWMETANNTLTLNPTFQTYLLDFCSSTKLLPKAIMQWLPGTEKAHVDGMLTMKSKIKVEFFDSLKNQGWDECAGEHFVYETVPRADFKKIMTSKKNATPERREVKRQGSLKSLFRLEGAIQAS